MNLITVTKEHPDPKVTVTAFEDQNKVPRTRIKCSCCDRSVDFFFDTGFSEIGGVFASNEFWRKIFNQLPE